MCVILPVHLLPAKVSVVYWNADAWYGGGIMHQKLWISDSKNIYIGSANMDWKSLSQVKELGVYAESTALAEDLTNYFEQWIEWGSLPAEGQAPITTPTSPNAPISTVEWSTDFDCNLTKPCWSKVRTYSYQWWR
jgi:phospholipase D3/4